MNDSSMLNATLHQAAVAVIAAHVMQWLKKLPYMDWLGNPLVARFMAGIAVVIGALGVHIQLSGTLESGGSFTLAWPMLSVMIDGAEHLVIQWVIQERYYQKFLKPQASIPVTFQNPPPHAPEPLKA
jgi:hypothetical protein